MIAITHLSYYPEVGIAPPFLPDGVQFPTR